MKDNAVGGKVLWILAGAAIGASFAILYAPAAGEKTRRTLALKTESGRASLTGSGKEMLERGRDMFERGRKLAEEAADMFERGRQLMDNTAARLPQA